jgi:hypothetical protein
MLKQIHNATHPAARLDTENQGMVITEGTD